MVGTEGPVDFTATTMLYFASCDSRGNSVPIVVSLSKCFLILDDLNLHPRGFDCGASVLAHASSTISSKELSELVQPARNLSSLEVGRDAR